MNPKNQTPAANSYESPTTSAAAAASSTRTPSTIQHETSSNTRNVSVDPYSTAQPHIMGTQPIHTDVPGGAGKEESTNKEPSRTIIRQIINIDKNKLQQSGLDRKIAEALSKQKFKTKSATVTAVENPIPTVNYTLKIQKARSQPQLLTPSERLIEAKKFLSLKLLTKGANASTLTTTAVPIAIHARPTTTIAGQKTETISSSRIITSAIASSLKRVDTKVNATKKLPVKKIQTPQEIARVLDFDGSVQSNFPKISHEKIPQNVQPKPGNNSPEKVQQKLPVKVANNSPVNETYQRQQRQPNFLDIFMKHAFENKEIPKASIRKPFDKRCIPPTSPIPGNYETKSFKNNECPGISPLKIAFPTTTLPQEAPLPTISTFKKPFLPQKGIAAPLKYELSDAKQHTTKSLIVLEDKVLSHDEKIDLTTVFGLADPSGSQHVQMPLPKPIIIKEEKHDDMHTFNLPAIGETISTNPNEGLVVVNPTQPKKFIIAADKLKLSKDKIADLAKQIKTQVSQKSKKKNLTETVAKNKGLGLVALNKPNIEIQKTAAHNMHENVKSKQNISTQHEIQKEAIKYAQNKGNIDNTYNVAPIPILYGNTIVNFENTSQVKENTLMPNTLMHSDLGEKSSFKPVVTKIKTIEKYSNLENLMSTSTNVETIQEQYGTITFGTTQNPSTSIFGAKPSTSLTKVNENPIIISSQTSKPTITSNQNPTIAVILNSPNNSTKKSTTVVKDGAKTGGLDQKTLNTNFIADLIQKPNTKLILLKKISDTSTISKNTTSASVQGTVTNCETQNLEPVKTQVNKAHIIDFYEKPTTSSKIIQTSTSGKETGGCDLNETALDSTLSAVDFIASLTASNTFNENYRMELSAEERNLNDSLNITASEKLLLENVTPTEKMLLQNATLTGNALQPKSQNDVDATALITQIFDKHNSMDLRKENWGQSETEAFNTQFADCVKVDNFKNDNNDITKKSNTVAGGLNDEVTINEVANETTNDNQLNFDALNDQQKQVKEISNAENVLEHVAGKVSNILDGQNYISTLSQPDQVTKSSKITQDNMQIAEQNINDQSNDNQTNKISQQNVVNETTEVCRPKVIGTLREEICELIEDQKHLIENIKHHYEEFRDPKTVSNEQSSSTASRQPSRLKKGKINLVQRKNITTERKKGPKEKQHDLTQDKAITKVEKDLNNENLSDELKITKKNTFESLQTKSVMAPQKLPNLEETQAEKSSENLTTIDSMAEIVDPVSIDKVDEHKLNESKTTTESLSSYPKFTKIFTKKQPKNLQDLQTQKDKETEVAKVLVSLIQPPEEIEEKILKPAKNPFRHQSLEVKINEETVGITCCINQKEDNKLQKEKAKDDLLTKNVPIEHQNTTNSANQDLQQDKELTEVNTSSQVVSESIKNVIKSKPTSNNSVDKKSNQHFEFDSEHKISEKEVEKINEADSCVDLKIVPQSICVEKHVPEVQQMPTNGTHSKNNILDSDGDLKETTNKRLNEINIKNSKSTALCSDTISNPNMSKEETSVKNLNKDDKVKSNERPSRSGISKIKTEKEEKHTQAIVEEKVTSETNNINKTIQEQLKSSKGNKKRRFDSKISNTSTQSDIDVTDFDCSTIESNDETAEENCSQEQSFTRTLSKRIRKAFDGIKRGREVNTETDTDEHFSSSPDSNEFLGFDETFCNNIEEKLNILIAATSAEEEESDDKRFKTKDKKYVDVTTRDSQSTNKKNNKSTASLKVTAKTMPLKKRWEFAHKPPTAETDISDDTSPANDEDDDIITGNKKHETLTSKIAKKRHHEQLKSPSKSQTVKKPKLFMEGSPEKHKFAEPQTLSAIKLSPTGTPEKEFIPNKDISKSHLDNANLVEEHSNIIKEQRRARPSRKLLEAPKVHSDRLEDIKMETTNRTSHVEATVLTPTTSAITTLLRKRVQKSDSTVIASKLVILSESTVLKSECTTPYVTKIPGHKLEDLDKSAITSNEEENKEFFSIESGYNEKNEPKSIIEIFTTNENVKVPSNAEYEEEPSISKATKGNSKVADKKKKICKPSDLFHNQTIENTVSKTVLNAAPLFATAVEKKRLRKSKSNTLDTNDLFQSETKAVEENYAVSNTSIRTPETVSNILIQTPETSIESKLVGAAGEKPKRGRKSKLSSSERNDTSLSVIEVHGVNSVVGNTSVSTMQTPETNIESESVAAAGGKAKRGRKSKLSILERSDMSLSVIEVGEDNSAMGNTSIPLIQTPETNIESESVAAAGGKAKRGRKSKLSILERNDMSLSVIEVGGDNSAVDNTSIPTPETNIESEPVAAAGEKPKRGRKAKLSILERSDMSLSVVEVHGDNSMADNTSIPTMQTTETQVEPELIIQRLEKKKRGRKPKLPAVVSNDITPEVLQVKTAHIAAADDTANVSNSEELNIGAQSQSPNVAANISVEKKKPGRKRLQFPVGEGDTNVETLEVFNKRLLLICSRSQLATDEELTSKDGKPAAGFIKCGLCLGNTKKDKWLLHLGEHYGVGWIDGEPALDITNRYTVLNTMTHYYKQTKVKGLNCRVCKNLYRSALGLLIHVESCGISAEEQRKNRVNCTYCNKSYTKLSLTMHIRSCAVLIAAEKAENAVNTDDMPTEEVFNNVGRIKRVSLIKAESIIKKIGEESITTNTSSFDPTKHIKFVESSTGTDWQSKCQAEILEFGKCFCSQIVCKFFCMNLVEMEDHMQTCKHIVKAGYHCTICKRKTSVFKTNELALRHVNKTHRPRDAQDFEGDSTDCDLGNESTGEDDSCSSGVDSNEENITDSEDDDDDAANFETDSNGKKIKIKKKKRRIRKKPNLASRLQPVFPQRYSNVDKHVVNSWKEFISKNYTLDDILFSSLTPKIYSLDNEKETQLEKSLPRHYESIKFSFTTFKNMKNSFGAPASETTEWLELKRFETHGRKADLITFIGAPIKTLAWAPLPKDCNTENQYLALCYRKDINKYTRFLQPKIQPTHILIHKINIKSDNDTDKIKLHYALHIADGPVHCLEFLPSGGYSLALNRLGLLAVGTACSNIHVYSLPLEVPESSNIQMKDLLKLNVINLQVAFVLTLNLSSMAPDISTEVQCLKIKWSEFRGHNFLFAGFSNGFIGTWDISDDENENLNRFIVNDVRHFVPLNYFYSGEKTIQDMALHYDTNGLRWLAVSAYGRTLMVFDLCDLTNPFNVRNEIAKNIILSLDWPLMWENVVMALGSALQNNGESLLIRSTIGLQFNSSKVLAVPGGATQAKFNPWFSLCVTTSEYGDLYFQKMREMHFETNLRSKSRIKVVESLDVKYLDGKPMHKPAIEIKSTNADSTENWQMMFEDDYKEKYGLVFTSLEKLPCYQNLSEKREPPENITRYMRINCVSWNLNSSGRNLLACGYDNGFLRILNFKPTEFFD